MTKKNKGGKRKGAGRPKLGRDKLLTVRLSATTIDRLGARPALTVRSFIEHLVGGGATSADDDSLIFRGGIGGIAKEKFLILQEMLLDAYRCTTNEGEREGILQQLIEASESTLSRKKKSANLVKD